MGAHQLTLQGLHKTRSASADRGDSLKLTVDTPRTGVQENPKGVALPTPEWEKKSDLIHPQLTPPATGGPKTNACAILNAQVRRSLFPARKALTDSENPFSESDSDADTPEDCVRPPSTLRLWCRSLGPPEWTPKTLTCFTEVTPETEERDLEAEREAKALDAERLTLRDETTLRKERLVWTAPSTHRLPKPFTVTSHYMYPRLMRWKGLLCSPEREKLARLACASMVDDDHTHYCAAWPGWTNRLYYLGVTLFEWSEDPSSGHPPRYDRLPTLSADDLRALGLVSILDYFKPVRKKVRSCPPSPTRVYDLTLGLAPLPRALWLGACIQAKAPLVGFSRRDIHRWHNRWIPQKKAARPPRTLNAVLTPRGGHPIETIRRSKEKPRCGVEPPVVLPLVVRTALRLMECHCPARRPPPTRPDPPRAGPAQTYAPTQPHPPRFMHTTREEWRDLLFLSYEFHAKRERWRAAMVRIPTRTV